MLENIDNTCFVRAFNESKFYRRVSAKIEHLIEISIINMCLFNICSLIHSTTKHQYTTRQAANKTGKTTRDSLSIYVALQNFCTHVFCWSS